MEKGTPAVFLEKKKKKQTYAATSHLTPKKGFDISSYVQGKGKTKKNPKSGPYTLPNSHRQRKKGIKEHTIFSTHGERPDQRGDFVFLSWLKKGGEGGGHRPRFSLEGGGRGNERSFSGKTLRAFTGTRKGTKGPVLYLAVGKEKKESSALIPRKGRRTTRAQKGDIRLCLGASGKEEGRKSSFLP